MDNLNEYMRIAGIKYRATAKGKANILLRHAKNRSEKRKIDFDLDKNWLVEKLNYGKCELSDIEFDFSSNGLSHFNPLSPSIDRIDPNKGYTKDNCRVVLVCVNFGIGQWGIDIYKKVAKAVINTQNNKNIDVNHT